MGHSIWSNHYLVPSEQTNVASEGHPISHISQRYWEKRYCY